jgi:hypothetical protein
MLYGMLGRPLSKYPGTVCSTTTNGIGKSSANFIIKLGRNPHLTIVKASKVCACTLRPEPAFVQTTANLIRVVLSAKIADELPSINVSGSVDKLVAADAARILIGRFG